MDDVHNRIGQQLRANFFLLGNRLASQVMNIGNCLPFIFAKQQKLLEVCLQLRSLSIRKPVELKWSEKTQDNTFLIGKD